MSRLDDYPRGPSWWRELARDQGGDSFVIAFSRGKDSVAASLALLAEGFDLHPFTYISVPGLSFVEESLDYYERTLFGGRRIKRVFGVGMMAVIKAGHYLSPPRLAVADALAFPFDEIDIQLALVEEAGLPEDTMCATAVRANDNVMRRRIITFNGPVVTQKNQFYAIWDWRIDDVISTIAKSGLRLPADYRMWGRTFQHYKPDMLVALKKNYPEDWKRFLKWFPLAEAAAFRWEQMRHHDSPDGRLAQASSRLADESKPRGRKGRKVAGK
jgi:hypothetical protein